MIAIRDIEALISVFLKVEASPRIELLMMKTYCSNLFPNFTL